MERSIEQVALSRCGFSLRDVEVEAIGQGGRDGGGCVVEIHLTPEQTDEFIAQRYGVVADLARRGVRVSDRGWQIFLEDLYALRQTGPRP